MPIRTAGTRCTWPSGPIDQWNQGSWWEADDRIQIKRVWVGGAGQGPFPSLLTIHAGSGAGESAGTWVNKNTKMCLVIPVSKMCI